MLEVTGLEKIHVIIPMVRTEMEMVLERDPWAFAKLAEMGHIDQDLVESADLGHLCNLDEVGVL